MANSNGSRDKGRQDGGVTVVIRREELVEVGHHGGAWKVAYADFVTAMMAFFLLMWLLNATTEAQRTGLADYFSPSNAASHSFSGNGQPFGGHTPNDQGSLASDRGQVRVIDGRAPIQPEQNDDPDAKAPGQPTPTPRPDPTPAPPPSGPQAAAAPPPPPPPSQSNGQSNSQSNGQSNSQSNSQVSSAAAAQAASAETQAFEHAATALREAIKSDPAVADLAKQLSVDITPEGLRIQILDADQKPMFSSGAAALNDRARLLLQKIAPILLTLPEGIAIAGHTDSAPFAGPDRTNWELSTERANASRRVLTESGLPDDRIRRVDGKADREPLLPDQPLAAANRRITIIALRQPNATAMPGGS
jgi:chemotaxis protein MotB